MELVAGMFNAYSISVIAIVPFREMGRTIKPFKTEKMLIVL